ncbi:MAG: hypothetical protein WBW62_09710, partial [Solirubrobacterales bacterium]
MRQIIKGEPDPNSVATRGCQWGTRVSLLALLTLLMCFPGSSSGEAPTRKKVAAIDLRFVDSAAIRSQGQRLSAATGPDLKEARRLEAETGAKSMKPLVAGISQATVSRLSGAAEARSGVWNPDMASWYRFTLSDAADVAGALRILRESPIVSTASPA